MVECAFNSVTANLDSLHASGCVFDGRVPIFLGERVGVSDNVANRVTVLETSKFAFSISNSKDQVTSPFGCLHSVDGLVQGGIPLEDISEDKSEGISQSAFFSK